MNLLCRLFGHKLTLTGGHRRSGMCRRCRWWFLDGKPDGHDSDWAPAARMAEERWQGRAW